MSTHAQLHVFLSLIPQSAHTKPNKGFDKSYWRHLCPFLISALCIPNSGKHSSSCSLLETEKQKALAGCDAVRECFSKSVLWACNRRRDLQRSNIPTPPATFATLLRSQPGALLDFSHTAEHHQSRHPASVCRLQKAAILRCYIKELQLILQRVWVCLWVTRQAGIPAPVLCASFWLPVSKLHLFTKRPPEQQPRNRYLQFSVEPGFPQGLRNGCIKGILRWLGRLHWAGWLSSQCWEHILLSGAKCPWNKDERWQHQAMTTALLRL